MPIIGANTILTRDQRLDELASQALVAWATGNRGSHSPLMLARRWVELRAALADVLP